jgi:hypothetical protein
MFEQYVTRGEVILIFIGLSVGAFIVLAAINFIVGALTISLDPNEGHGDDEEGS